MIERQELWCHECHNYVQFDLDFSLDGNHILNCPRCGHAHCRVVRGGKITDIRWATGNGSTYTCTASSVTWSATSTYATSSSTDPFLYSSWMNTTTGA